MRMHVKQENLAWHKDNRNRRRPIAAKMSNSPKDPYDSGAGDEDVAEGVAVYRGLNTWSFELDNNTPLTCMDEIVTCSCSKKSDCRNEWWVLLRASMSMRPDHEAASTAFMYELLKTLPDDQSYCLTRIKEELSFHKGAPWVIAMVDGEMENRHM
jgi:hypothetical protein